MGRCRTFFLVLPAGFTLVARFALSAGFALPARFTLPAGFTLRVGSILRVRSVLPFVLAIAFSLLVAVILSGAILVPLAGDARAQIIDVHDPDSWEGPVLIAHRGGVVTPESAENTAAAVRLAAEQGFRMIEVDVRESKDHVPVAFHDRSLSEAAGVDAAIEELTLEEIRVLRYRHTGQSILTLDQIFELCARLELGVMLDIKSNGSERLFRRIAELIAEHGLTRSAITFSGHPLALQHLEGLVKFAVTEEEEEAARRGEPISLQQKFWFGLPRDIDEETVTVLKERGAVVIPAINIFRYPPENHMNAARADVERMLAAGVDAFQIDGVYRDFFVSESRADPPRGYTIPVVDISGEADRQVIVDRESGQYLGHPTTVLLEDGRTILAVYPKGHGRGPIVLKRSADGGRTWSDRLPVPENWSTSQETPTIYRVMDPAGKARLILFSGLYPIRMSYSEDDGETWTPLEPIGDFGGIVAMADLVRVANGDYLAFFHDDGRFFTDDGEPGQFFVYQTRSTDGGMSWAEPEMIITHPDADLCEPGVIRSPDGDQLAMLLRENSRRHNSMLSISNDEGTSWSEPVELPGALTGDRHQAAYAPDGRLFVSFRDMAHGSSTWGDWVGWVGTYDDIVSGGEGQYRVRIMDNTREADTAYPGVEVLPDGTFVVTTYGHWTAGEAPYIVSVRFTLNELDERMRASSE